MSKLPVIVSFGGINAAGRSSFHHAYKRMVHEQLDSQSMASTWTDLGNRMALDLSNGITPEIIQEICSGTLIRRISGDLYNPSSVYYQRSAALKNESGFSFTMKKRQLPQQPPESWQIRELDSRTVEVTTDNTLDILIPGHYTASVSAAGQLPEGFRPGSLYDSRHHPRAIQMTVYGASDALLSMGLDWDQLLTYVRPDQVAVYSGSSLAQMDEHGAAGLFRNPMAGNRISSKMMAMEMPQMSADFINSYIINSAGRTGTNVGACATSLYNLNQGIEDIRSGRARIVIVGNAEAPVVPEIMEGFGVMGALSTDEQLCRLDATDIPDFTRACRPFSDNAGFVMGESGQFMILMDDELAMETGALIHGAAAGVFINADANKKSISAPGVGNYITMAKAAALAEHLLGPDGLQRTFVQAHGTGTPQNRVTESHILNEVAKTFGISGWKVAAMKSYLGHSLGAAGLDQIIPALGVWEYGHIPGIHSIDHLADDLHHSHLDILMKPGYAGDRGQEIHAALINSKGFGGNNASALILSPHRTMEMLGRKYGAGKLTELRKRQEKTAEAAADYDARACAGKAEVIYRFGQDVMTPEDVALSRSQVSLRAFANAIDMDFSGEFGDYL